MALKQYNFKIDEGQLERLQKVSDKDGVDVSELIRTFIKNGLKDLGTKRFSKYLLERER